MKNLQYNYFNWLTIIIAVGALTVSLFSLKLSVQNTYINQKEVQAGKNFEIISLMKQFIDLKKAEYEHIQKIIWSYENDGNLLTEFRDGYNFWKAKKNKVQNELYEEYQVQEKILKDESENHINLIENYIGYYHVSIVNAIRAKDRAAEHLNNLENKIFEVSLFNTISANTKDKTQLSN